MTLRHDARFSDGTLVTASAVKAWSSTTRTSRSKGCCHQRPQAEGPAPAAGQWTMISTSTTPNSKMPYMLCEAEMFGFMRARRRRSRTRRRSARGPTARDRTSRVPSQSVSGSTYVFRPDPHYYDQYGGALLEGGCSEDHQLADHHDRGDRVGAARTSQASDVATAATAKAAELNVVAAPQRIRPDSCCSRPRRAQDPRTARLRSRWPA